MSEAESTLIAQKLIALGLLKSDISSYTPSYFPQPNFKRVRWPTEQFDYDNFRPISHGHSRFTSTISRKPSTLRITPQPPFRQGMTGMSDIDRIYTRRGERTFIGSQCVVCDEPLEHTLRGERVLQLSCSHVSHEACFYEYIRHLDSRQCPECGAALGLDSGRGGNVVDIEKLSNIVRSLQAPQSQYANEGPPQSSSWSSSQTQNGSYNHQQQQYDQQDARGYEQQYHPNSYHNHSHSQQSQRSRRTHTRNGSSGSTQTARASSVGRNSAPPKKPEPDVDIRSIETSALTAAKRSSITSNPVQPPKISIRSEYPTMTRSKQQQSLTCLITIEVPDTHKRPQFGDGDVVAESVVAKPPPVPPKEVEKKKIEEEPGESDEELERITEDLLGRVDNWHGLDYSRFGPLRLHSKLQVGKDRRSWQELECYLFAEMLICVKEKKIPDQAALEENEQVPKRSKATLKGSIMIKKHLNNVETSEVDETLLTLNLSVPELPMFHLHFPDRKQLHIWQQVLNSTNGPDNGASDDEAQPETDDEGQSGTDDEGRKETVNRTISSRASSRGDLKSNGADTTDYADFAENAVKCSSVSLHAPVDFVVVIPVSSSMHGIKIDLLRDSLRFLLQSLGPRDRMGLVAFGSTAGVSHVAGLTGANWPGWPKVLESLKAASGKSAKGDLVEGANVAMDLLMQRKTVNPVSSIVIISDSSVSEGENIDFVISRAEAAKVAIFSFGLGLTHKPDAMIELSTRTEASYTYVKDWMMLRECVAGCLGSLQSISHQSVTLMLRLPNGTPARFAKISGGLQVTKRFSGTDAECLIGDLRFGDKRDILVQLAVIPEASSSEAGPPDAWDTIVSGLEALGGPLDSDPTGTASIEEIPVLQADLVYGNIVRSGSSTSSPRPSLLTITMLAPAAKYKSPRPISIPIPPHPSIVQRRMELLTSDMLTRSLTLVARNQHERAHHLLRETRAILAGLGKGNLPPVPLNKSSTVSTSSSKGGNTPSASTSSNNPTGSVEKMGFPTANGALNSTAGVDADIMAALDAELEGALEWINHPTIFVRDSRKAVLQAIGVISSQRAYTYRSSLETHWANRVSGIRELIGRSRNWRASDDDSASLQDA